MMALGIIGGVIGAIGSIASAQASANATNAQAAAYERQAALERQQAAYNASQQQDKAVALISQQRTAMLASGVSLYGTPTDVLVNTTNQTDLDVQAIKYNGEIKAQNFESQAGALRAKASAQQTAGAFGAISPLIKGFGGASSGGDFSFGGSSSVEDG